MTDLLQVLALAFCGVLLLTLVELVRRRMLVEEYALVWAGGVTLLFLLSLSRRALEAMAGWLGIQYPPSLLLLAVVLFVILESLFFTVVVSKQRKQIHW